MSFIGYKFIYSKSYANGFNDYFNDLFYRISSKLYLNNNQSKFVESGITRVLGIPCRTYNLLFTIFLKPITLTKLNNYKK